MTNELNDIDYNRIIFDSEFGDNYDELTKNTKMSDTKLKWLSQIKTNDKIKILDVGGGTGSITIELYKIFPNATIYALDVSKNLLDIFKNKLNQGEKNRTVFIVNDAKKYLNSSDIYFDLIFFASVLHHIAGYNEIIDLCTKKTNAIYIASEPFRPNGITRLFRSVDYRLSRLIDPVEIKGDMDLIQKTELPYISPEEIIKTLQENDFHIDVYYKLAGYMNRFLRPFGPKTHFQILAIKKKT